MSGRCITSLRQRRLFYDSSVEAYPSINSLKMASAKKIDTSLRIIMDNCAGVCVNRIAYIYVDSTVEVDFQQVCLIVKKAGILVCYRQV